MSDSADLRLNHHRWRLKRRDTGLRVYLRAGDKAEAKARAAELYGGVAADWKAKRVEG